MEPRILIENVLISHRMEPTMLKQTSLTSHGMETRMLIENLLRFTLNRTCYVNRIKENRVQGVYTANCALNLIQVL